MLFCLHTKSVIDTASSAASGGDLRHQAPRLVEYEYYSVGALTTEYVE